MQTYLVAERFHVHRAWSYSEFSRYPWDRNFEDVGGRAVLSAAARFRLGVSNQFGEAMIGPGGVDQAWNFMHAMLSTRA